MGKIENVSTEIVKPIQIDLDYSRLVDVFAYYERGERDLLLPVPVKKINRDYLILDGHHRTAVAHLVDRNITAYIVEDIDDLLNPSKYPESARRAIKDNNENIRFNFNLEKSKYYRLDVIEKGFNSIEDLLKNIRIYSLSDLKKICQSISA